MKKGSGKKCSARIPNSSLGSRVISQRWHNRMQLDRFPIQEFVRRTTIPLMGDYMRILDAGSGRLSEQHLRGSRWMAKPVANLLRHFLRLFFMLLTVKQGCWISFEGNSQGWKLHSVLVSVPEEGGLEDRK